MLNAKAVAALLAVNSDERLCKRWFLMTLNGTLLAYTQPTNIRDLRRHAAIATMTWREHRGALHAKAPDSGETGAAEGDSLHTLTVESDCSNLIMRRVQPQLLLVLEGGVPPRRATFEPRVTAECGDDAPRTSRSSSAEVNASSSLSSASDSGMGKAATSVLAMQRRKFEALASAIAHDLEQSGFRIPETSTTKLF